MKRGILMVVSSPSGGGKGTIVKELLTAEKNLRLSVSATTRQPRPGEENGVHYFFLSRAEFEEMIAQGKMLEHAEFVGNYYGTPREPVENWLKEGKDVLLEIEVQGGAQIKKLAHDCVSVFILPPSMKVLEQRLRSRGTEDEETIRKRLDTAREEIPHAEEYDYVVINNRLEDAVDEVRAILKAEKLKYSRNADCLERVLQNVEAV